MPPFNPFHHWLGLRENISNPHHYQLLGIRPADDKETLTKAAKQKLAALKSADRNVENMTSEQVDELIEKIRKRIVTAHKILSDAKLRSEYDVKLKAMIAKVKSTPQNGSNQPALNADQKPVPAKIKNRATTEQKTATEPAGKQESVLPVHDSLQNPPTVDQGLLPPQMTAVDIDTTQIEAKKAAKKPKVVVGLPPQSIEAGPNIQPHTTPEQPAIPMAVPIAQIPATGAGEAGNPSLSQPAVAVAIPVSNVDAPVLQPSPVLDTENSSPPFVPPSIQKRPIAKRNRSWAVPIISSVLALGGIGGLILFMMNYERFIATPTIADIDPNTPAAVSADKGEPNDESTSQFETNPPIAKTANESTDKNGGNSSVKSNVVDDPFDNPNTTSAPTNPKPKSIRQLNFNDHVQFRQAMNGARWAMIRRDKANTMNAIQNAQGLFNGLSAEQRWSDEDQKLKELADSTSEVMGLLEGFWNQVVSSAESLKGGAEIQVGETILGFVETRTGMVILRHAGVNVAYAYEFLPAGLAKRIAEAGTKEDVPTFRMQLAAFYAVHVPIDISYAEKAISFARLAEQDGHDPSSIIRYVENDLATIGVVDSKALWPNDSDLENQIDEAKRALQVRSVVGMTPATARSLVNAIFDRIPEYPDNLRPGLFGLGIRAAIQSGSCDLAYDVLQEAKVWTEVDQSPVLMDALQKISMSKELDARLSRKLVEAVIAECKDKDLESAVVKRLVRNSNRLVEQHQLGDLQRRLSALSK